MDYEHLPVIDPTVSGRVNRLKSNMDKNGMKSSPSSLAFPIFSEARLGSERSWRRSSEGIYGSHLSRRG